MNDDVNEKNTTLDKRATKSAASAVIAGIFIIALGFAAYKYFNKPLAPEIGNGAKTQNINQEVEDDSESDLLVGNQEITNNPQDKVIKNLNPQTLGAIFANAQVKDQWVATDYKSGDIKGSSYTVKSGDTLWEIAEARYGSGAEWGKVLQANKANVGFLANGSQALIVTGQTLVLP